MRSVVQTDSGASGIHCEQGGKWLLVACQALGAGGGNLSVLPLDAAGDPGAVVHRAQGLYMPVAVVAAP